MLKEKLVMKSKLTAHFHLRWLCSHYTDNQRRKMALLQFLLIAALCRSYVLSSVAIHLENQQTESPSLCSQRSQGRGQIVDYAAAMAPPILWCGEREVYLWKKRATQTFTAVTKASGFSTIKASY